MILCFTLSKNVMVCWVTIYTHRSTSVCTVKYNKIQIVINNYYDLLVIYISSLI